MPSNPRIPKSNPPTRIARRPQRGQMPFSFDGRERPERLRVRRRRARIVTAFITFVFIGLGILGIGRASYASRLTISDIAIAGTKDASPETMRETINSILHDNVFHLFSRANIFLYPKNDIHAALLENVPRLEAVSISRASLLSQAIMVNVREREEFARWCKELECYSLDRRGFIFAKTVSGNGYAFYGGLMPGEVVGQTFLRGGFSSTVALLEKLKEKNHVPVRLSVENEHDFAVTLESGLVLKISFEADSETIVKNFELALSSDTFTGGQEELEYVDLRFGDRVYYKMK